MALIILVFSAISALVGIWLGYWGERKSASNLEKHKLHIKRTVSIISSIFLLVGLALSYMQLKSEASESNTKLERELANYRKIDTVKQAGMEAKNEIDTIRAKSEQTLSKFEGLNLNIDKTISSLREVIPGKAVISITNVEIKHRLATL